MTATWLIITHDRQRIDGKARAHCMKKSGIETDKTLVTSRYESLIHICEVEIGKFCKVH
jgi:hypothetical protein